MTQGTVLLTRKLATPHRGSRTRLPARLGARLGSPVALASAIVCLVAIVGLVASFATYRSLIRIGERHERASVDARTREIRMTVEGALSLADEILARIEPATSRPSAATAPETLLGSFSDVAFGPRGVTWVSASFPDGTFVGVRRHEDGTMAGYVDRASDRTETRYRLDPTGASPVSVTPTDYDPRRRAFYTLALGSSSSVWTPPYPFLPDLHTGVTRTRAVRRDGQLIAVITADFDATELTKLLGDPITPSEKAIVTIGDAVLAARGVTLPPGSSRTVERPLRVADLEDPLLTSIFTTKALRVERDGHAYRISRTVVGILGTQPIHLHIVVPEDELYASAVAEAKAGMLTTALVALFGLLLATVISANVASLRRRRAEAETAAAIARAQIEDLGSYELGEKIGSGGMGEVFRATHRLLARDAAVKVIKLAPGEDPEEGMQRFFREAKILASLRSLHTVMVYDFGVSADDRYFLAMELLYGLDLDTLVRIYGPQRPARVIAILAQICDSLAEAHEAGYVHQDIKPANVFLCRIADSLDFVKVLDFGLTRAIGRRPLDGRNVEGTPAFMAPEQVRGDEVTYATDLYAIGCVGYYLLCGRYPYASTTSEGYMRAHVELPIPSLPDSVRALTPDGLVQLVTRCLAKKAENRPMSARALGNALRRVGEGCAGTFTESDLRDFWRDRDAIVSATSAHRQESLERVAPGPKRVVRADVG